jgi:hypothetical protein
MLWFDTVLSNQVSKLCGVSYLLSTFFESCMDILSLTNEGEIPERSLFPEQRSEINSKDTNDEFKILIDV